MKTTSTNSDETKSVRRLKARLAELRREPTSVVTIAPGVLATLRDLPHGTPLYGTAQQTDDGDTHYSVLGHQPRDGLTCVGSLGFEGNAGELLEIDLDPERPRAVVAGRRAAVVSVDPERYRDRISALPGADAVARRRALVVGLGSVGSALSTTLVRCGVDVTACDPDRLEVQNLVRWGLDVPLSNVGRRKTTVWADCVRDTVPDARAVGVPMDVVRDAAGFDGLLRDTVPHLLVAATDTLDSQRTINAMGARHEVPVLYVMLSDHARSARFEVVSNAAAGPCHLCSTRCEDALFVPERRSRTPYANSPPPAGAVPALPCNVQVATAFATRVALALLADQPWQPFFRHGRQSGQVLFVALEPDWWLFDAPLDRFAYQPRRHPDCPVCAQGGAS